jgi:photosystem II stability/assembly factor-like uncharacterized protein
MLRTTAIRKILLVGLLTLLIVSQAGPALAGINVWNSNGPEGGVIWALAIDPTTPSTIYAGTSDGVFKSTTSGGNWSAVNTGLNCGMVRSLAIDPITPSIIYAGSSGCGVFRSTNGGDNWSIANTGMTSADVWTITIDPTNPSTLYAGVSSDGVFKSTNSGGNWSAINNGLTIDTGLPVTSTVRALAIDPTTSSTIYAGLFPWNVFKSTDGGDNWNTAGLDDAYVRALAIDPVNPSTIYAGIQGGVYKSTTGGGIWSEINNGLTNTAVRALAIDPTDPSTIYAGTDGGVFKSTSSGGAWIAFNNGLTNTTMLSLAINPVASSTLYAGTSGSGVFSIQQIAVLAINYSSGAPGSYFTLTGSNFPPNRTATISVNGNVLGTVLTDSSGSFIFSLETNPTTEEGFYRVTVSVNPSASTQFTLDVADDVHPREGSETVFVVPDGIAYHVVYLPLIVK